MIFIDDASKNSLICLMVYPTVEAHLPWLLETFRPDLVLYDAGVDPHWEDELGRLRLTDQGEPFCFTPRCFFTFKSLTDFLNDFKCPLGLYQRDLFVLKTVVKRGVPIAAVIGGGYSRDIDKLALRHSIVHRAATQVNETQQIEDLFVQFYVQKQLVLKQSSHYNLAIHVSGLEGVWYVKLGSLIKRILSG